jgi:hypothetical protein
VRECARVCVWNTGETILTGVNERTRRKPRPVATIYNINTAKLTGLGSTRDSAVWKLMREVINFYFNITFFPHWWKGERNYGRQTWKLAKRSKIQRTLTSQSSGYGTHIYILTLEPTISESSFSVAMISVRAIKVGKGSTYCLDQAIFHHSSQEITNLFHSQHPASKRIEIKCSEHMDNMQSTSNQAAVNGTSPDNGIFECNCVMWQNMHLQNPFYSTRWTRWQGDFWRPI